MGIILYYYSLIICTVQCMVIELQLQYCTKYSTVFVCACMVVLLYVWNYYYLHAMSIVVLTTTLGLRASNLSKALFL